MAYGLISNLLRTPTADYTSIAVFNYLSQCILDNVENIKLCVFIRLL